MDCRATEHLTILQRRFIGEVLNGPFLSRVDKWSPLSPHFRGVTNLLKAFKNSKVVKTSPDNLDLIGIWHSCRAGNLQQKSIRLLPI